jgi:LPS-assembly protein
LLDRGVEEQVAVTAAYPGHRSTRQPGRRRCGRPGPQGPFSQTRVAGNVEYLSSYVYRLVFNDNYSQAVSSEVQATFRSPTRTMGSSLPSAGPLPDLCQLHNGDEARISTLPSLRYDVLDRPLGASPLYWGLGSSLGYLNRSEPHFHARNVGRIDFYPHLSLPLCGRRLERGSRGRAARHLLFHQPDPRPDRRNNGTPTISHDPLNRADVEASVDIRPPALERDFRSPGWNRELRHVIEPELTYRYVGGIGARPRMCCWSTPPTSPPTPTKLASRSPSAFTCAPSAASLRPRGSQASGGCPAKPREWASWQIAQKFFIDPNFGGALISNRRNVFDSTLDLTGVAFLTSPRNLHARHLAPALRGHRQSAHRVGPGLRPQGWTAGRGQPLCRLQLGPHHRRRGPRPAQRRRRERQHRFHHSKPAVAALPLHRKAQRRGFNLAANADTTLFSASCNTAGAGGL